MTNAKAIEVLKSECYVLPFLDGDRAALINTALDVAIEALKAQKVGQWITLQDEYGDIVEAVCSCCNQNGNHEWAFCPKCGAKMEGQE